MRHKRFPPDTSAEWLNRARSDLTIAQSFIKGAYLEDLCYHAQQAAEKAMKALLLDQVGKFPYVHDLAELIYRIEEAGVEVPADIRDGVTLNEYAVAARYPGFDDAVTETELNEAISKAKNIVKWVEKLIRGRKS